MQHPFPTCRVLISALVLTALATAQDAARRRCATPPRDPARVVPEGPGDCSFGATNPLAQYATTSVYRIPVVVHVIQATNGQGALSDPLIKSQIDILNEDFRAKAGTPGAQGFDTGIEFYLATTTPTGAATTGITRTTNDQWFQDLGNYWTPLAWDTNRYLNIYTNEASGALGYVVNLPQAGGLVGTTQDRVVIWWGAFGRSALGGPPYNLGRSCTHEVGHYLGLFHPFDNGCGSPGACYTTGDLICDTAPEALPQFGCPVGAFSCGTPDPIRNYMDYTDDACMTHFTSEQARRMRCTIQFWRPRVATSCALASSKNRNAGLNAQSLTVSPPVLGGTFRATVDLTTSGHGSAVLLAQLAPANLPWLNGFVILIDLQTPPGGILALPAGSGALAVFTFPLPNDPRGCGLPLYTQAVHFGGAVGGFALSNAQDVVFGAQ